MVQEGNSVLNFDYDFQADVLYCSFGAPQEAIGEEIEDGIVVRRADDNTVVGYTIVNFSKRFRQEPHRTLSLPFGRRQQEEHLFGL